MTNKLGLYIHVPFCAGRCPYCDFYTKCADRATRDAYVKAIQRDLLAREKEGYAFDTIYFGGGTPSVLDGTQVQTLLQVVRDHYSVAPDAEITVECNPSSNLEDFLPKVAKAGVNRVSLGMQSAVDRERQLLGRKADRNRVEEALHIARDNGISNLSLDIMLGVPEQTMDSLHRTLDFCLQTEVPHLSTYLLKLEEGTNFYRRRDKLALPSEETACTFYEETTRVLTGAGFYHYEISNFCKDGKESRHNLKYWRCQHYLGLGPAAHSYLNGTRFYYPRDLDAYLSGAAPIPDGTGGSFPERLMLALRLAEGFSEPLPESVQTKINLPYMADYLTYDGTALKLTERGFLVSNAVIGTLLEDY